MDRREQNIRVFFDTEQWYKTTEKLRRSIRKSCQGARFFAADAPLAGPGEAGAEPGKVCVTQERTFEAVMRLAGEFPDRRICALNFASATNPGGGVRSGSGAQEEALCRCSTLYPVLSSGQWRECYYDFHRNRKDPFYTDACIYTPDIIICKSDTAFPERLPESEWVRTDVITCAAPNLRHAEALKAEGGFPSEEDLLRIHTSRARRILDVAVQNHIEILVTGAFGCGAFRNDPRIVAQAWKDALTVYGSAFRQVVFAVFCSPRDKTNAEVFQSVLTGEGA